MLRSLLYFLKLAAYWFLFFTLYRLALILIYPDKIPDGKFSEALLALVSGLRLDLSAIAYAISVPLILWSIQQFVKKNFLNRISHFYNLALIAAFTLLCISNIAMYGEWNALINYNTLFYLAAPAKMFPYLTTLELTGVIIGAAVVIALFVLLFRLLILMVLPYSTRPMKYKLIIVPAIFPVLFVVMRGGFQQMPVNETFSYYSEVKFFNHVCINPAWHLGHTAFLGVEEENNQPPH